eukprot:m.262863 g.262863  ORF g.262863 m.262863 type:complete len:78 (+) comp15597_c0_seq2:573-806(+)
MTAHLVSKGLGLFCTEPRFEINGGYDWIVLEWSTMPTLLCAYENETTFTTESPSNSSSYSEDWSLFFLFFNTPELIS